MKSRLGLEAELPVVDIVQEAVELLWEKRADVIRMFLPAILILAAIDWASQHFFPGDAEAEVPVFHPEQLIFVLASVVLSILMATACHRFTLLPKEGWNANAIHSFGRNEFRYLLRGLQIAVCCMVVFFSAMMGLMALVGPERAIFAVAVAVMLMLYIWARLSITLPEVALGTKSDLARAWSMSKGNGSRLVVVVWVVPIIMALPFWLAFMAEDASGLLNYLAAFGIYLTTLVGLVMLSLSYRFLLDFYEGEEQPQQPQSQPDDSSFDA